MNEDWKELVEIANTLCTQQIRSDNQLKVKIKLIIKKIRDFDSSLTTELLKKRAVEIYVEQILTVNRYHL
jgi:hypothetical protein